MNTTTHAQKKRYLLAQELQCLVPDSFELAATGDGRLSGYSFVAKDLISITGHTSSFGHSRWRETHTPATETAPVVRLLLRAGANMVGLTKLDQLAYSLVGNVGEGEPPLNPLNRERFTGGSSSGLASAVAGGIADFGVGTDTAGSIRVPAVACGLFSIRPTHAVVNIDGVLPLAQSFDVVGFLARTPEMLKTAFETVSNQNALPPAKELLEIFIPEDILSSVQNDVAKALQLGAEKISNILGIQTRPIEFGRFVHANAGDTLARLQGREIWRNHAKWVQENSKYLAEDIRVRLERCQKFSLATEDEKQADIATRQSYIADYKKLIGERRAIVMPVMSEQIPLRTSSQEEQREFRVQTFRLIAPGSLCGAPQVVIPVRVSQTDRIYGISLLGAIGADLSLLLTTINALNQSAYLEV